MRTTSHRGRRVLHVLTAEQTCFVARTGAEVRWRSERQDQLVWADIIHQWMKRGKKMGCSVTVEEDVLPPSPFYQTPLGQLPLKIREQVYKYLRVTVSSLTNLRLTPQIVHQKPYTRPCKPSRRQSSSTLAGQIFVYLEPANRSITKSDRCYMRKIPTL